MTCAIIPRARRISAIMPSASGKNGEVLKGFTFQLATAEDYRRYAKENPYEGNILPNKSEHGLAKYHGVAVLMEIFDVVHVGVQFNSTELVDELSTLVGYMPKTRYCIISAVLRWAAAQDEPQIRKVGGKWVL